MRRLIAEGPGGPAETLRFGTGCTNRAAGIVAATSLVSLLVPGLLLAEGSRSLYPSTYDGSGSRANMEVRGSGSKYAGQVARRTFLYVYAEAGEYILVGSRNRGSGGDVRIFDPRDFGKRGDETVPSTADFACSAGTSTPGNHFAGAGRGTIANRSEELAGPHSADGSVTVPNGFLPCAYQAPTSGVFGVLFTPATSGSGPNGSVSNPAVANGTVAAWDVTVRASATSVTDLDGRVFTFAWVGDTGGSGRRLYSGLYYVTQDGYRYQQTLRGLDPYAFALYANGSGFLDSGNPLYRDIRGEDQTVSVLPGGIASQPAELPVFFSDITPGGANEVEVSRTLGALGISSNPPPPEVRTVVFRGNLGFSATTVGAGGSFEFITANTFTYEIIISRNRVDFSPTNPQNRVLRGVALTGLHTIYWDGRDNSGDLFPAGVDYPYTLTGRNGEAHFPFIDAEGNPDGGPTIRKLNGSGGTTVYFDDRGYVTRQGENVGTLNGLLCGGSPPVPPTPAEGLAGVDSDLTDGSGRYYRSWPGNGNKNRDCDSGSAFGDTKGLDLWVYEGTTALQSTLSIFDAPQFTDVGTSVSVPVAVFPGQTVFGTLVYRNDGIPGATGVTYGFTLGQAGNRPAAVSFPTLPPGGYSYDPGTGIVTFTTLPTTLLPAAQLDLPFNFVAPAAGLIPVVSTIGAANESAEATSPNTAHGLTVVIVSDAVTTVSVPPTAPTGALVPGEVTYGNDPAATAAAKNVTFSLVIGDATLRPAAVTFTSLPGGATAAYSPASGVVTFTDMPTTLGKGELLTVTFEYVAPASGTIPVTSAIATSTPESTTANNAAAGSTTFVATPDLTIDKSHAGSFTQGQVGATFTILVTNLGPGATVWPVAVTDTLPAGLTATGLVGPGWTCSVVALACARVDALAAGASYPPITLTVNVAADAPPTMVNSATVTGGGDVNPANNTDPDTVTVILLPDLTVSKSDAGNYTPGQAGVTWQLVVTNLGPGSTTGTVTVTESVPLDFTATALSGAGWVCILPPTPPQVATCTRSDVLGAGASYPPITLVADLSATATGQVVNRVDVAGGGELNTTNDTALDPGLVGLVPDLTVAKSHSGDFVAGQTGAAFTIATTNAGAAATTGTVTVADTPPAGLTPTAISGTGWACTLLPLSCSRGDVLVPGASYPSITLTVDVALAATGTLVNQAAVSGGGETNLANNTASDPVTVLPAPDLALTKSASGTFLQGGTGAFDIVVENVGTVASKGLVSVADALPAGLLAESAAGDGWSCRTLPLLCVRSNALLPGDSFPAIAIVVRVAPDAVGTLTNTAHVSGGGDTNPANNTDTADVTIAVPPDLTIEKSHAGVFTPGQVGATYTIVVRNLSTVAQTSPVVVGDILPDTLTATAVSGPGWSCSVTPPVCTRADDLAPGTSYPPITVTVDVAASATGEIRNFAAVFSTGETNYDNNDAVDSQLVAGVADIPLTGPALLLFALGLAVAGAAKASR